MKTTRRIEITKYSRVTVIQGERHVDDAAEEHKVSGVLDLLEGVPSTSSEQLDWDRSGPKDVPADNLPRRRTLFSLSDLLGLRKRK